MRTSGKQKKCLTFSVAKISEHITTYIWQVSNRDYLDIAEKLMRGGMSSVYSARLFTANNRYLKTFDEFLPSSFGLMVDANNLYGGVMQQNPLPQNSFELDEDIILDSILSTSEDSIVRYIVELDLDYPEELRNSHSDFWLAPTREASKLEWLGEYQEELREKLGMRLVSKTKKFSQTLFNKEHYTLHYITVELYVSLGLKVKKVHRVLKFHQSRCIFWT